VRTRKIVTAREMSALRRIAQAGGLTVTYLPDSVRYAPRDTDGGLPHDIVKRSIAMGALLVDGRDDLFGVPTSYRCRVPLDPSRGRS
jgi:hypothetical protein